MSYFSFEMLRVKRYLEDMLQNTNDHTYEYEHIALVSHSPILALFLLMGEGDYIFYY